MKLPLLGLTFLFSVSATAQTELMCRARAKEAAQLAFKSCMTDAPKKTTSPSTKQKGKSKVAKATHENKVGTKLPKKLVSTQISETLNNPVQISPKSETAINNETVSIDQLNEKLIEQELKEQSLDLDVSDSNLGAEMAVTLKSAKDLKFDQEPILPLEKVSPLIDSSKEEPKASVKEEPKASVKLETEAQIILD